MKFKRNKKEIKLKIKDTERGFIIHFIISAFMCLFALFYINFIAFAVWFATTSIIVLMLNRYWALVYILRFEK